MITSNRESPSASQGRMDESHAKIADSAWKSLYKVGGVAALAEIAIIVIQAPILILYPQPTTVMGHFTQFQSNKLLGLLNLDLRSLSPWENTCISGQFLTEMRDISQEVHNEHDPPARATTAIC